jgi:hypothetical protein
MAIQPLDQRISQMVADQQPLSFDAQTEQDVASQDSSIPERDEQYAQLGPLIRGLTDVGEKLKVFRQGAKNTETLETVVKENEKAIEAIQKQIKTTTPKKPKKTQVKPVEEAPPAETVTTTDVLQAEPKPEEILPLVPEAQPINLAVDRPDLIPEITPERVKEFLSGNLPDNAPFDISFRNIKNPDDIDYVVRKTVEMFKDPIFQAKRGKISDDELNSLAANLNHPPDLLKRMVGTVYNAEELQAAKIILTESSREIEKMRQQIVAATKAGKEDNTLLIDFTNQLSKHAAMMMNFKAAKSEAGRALRAARVYTDADGAVDVNVLNNLIAEMGGANNIKNMSNMMELLDDAQKAKFIQTGGSNIQNIGAAWKEMWMSSLMYAPATWERSFFGQALMTFMRPVDTAFASTAGRILDKPVSMIMGKGEAEDFVTFTESAIELANFITSIPNGWRAASQAWKTEMPVYNVGKNIDNLPDPAISAKLFKDPESPLAMAVDMTGKIIRLPFRNMLFIDEGTKAMVAQMELRKLAARDALFSIKNGVPVDDALMMMAKNITDPSTETMEMVHKAVKEGSLQSDLGGFGNWVMKTRQSLDQNFTGIPFGTVLAPFVKTVINAEKQILSRTPLAPLMSEVRAELAAGGARRQMALGKMSEGASLMGLAYWMTTEGMLTGLGPADPKMREYLKNETGWQACSIKAGDKYYSIAGLEPIGGLLCSAATVAEIGSVYGKEDDSEWNDLLLYSMLLPFKYIGQLPMMDGMGKLVDMIQEVSRDPKGERVGDTMNKFFGGITQNLVAGVVPVPMPFGGLLRQLERTLDPTKRDVTADPSMPMDIRYFDFAFRSFLANTPLLSDKVKPVRSILDGDEVTVGTYGAMQWLFPFSVKESKNDPLAQELLDLSKRRGRLIFNRPDKTAENIKLNDNEYSDLTLFMATTKINGKTLRQQIGLDVSSFKSETDGNRFLGLANKLSSTVSEYKKAALESPEFKSLYPDLAAQIQKNKMKADLHIDRIKREPQE